MSSQAELEESEMQLIQINQALKDSPEDSELLALKAELENLIQLTRDYLKSQGSGSSRASASTSTAGAGASTSAAAGAGSNKDAANASFTTGTDVMARWRKDGKFYQARIASVSGSTADPAYTVIFQIDKSTEVVRKGDVKALSESKKRALEYSNKDSDGAGSDTGPGGKKIKKSAAEKAEKKATKEDERKSRVAEQNNRQSSWQSFAKKGSKKKIPGVSGESMFRTPDNPHGRVGVVGSGKGMTSYAEKKRYKLEGDGAEEGGQ